MVIVGVSGIVGAPTVAALSAVVGAERIVAVTRNPESAIARGFAAKGVTVAKGGYNSKDTLVEIFAGASAVFLITPGCNVRVPEGVV